MTQLIKYGRIWREHLRLTLLRLLAEQPAFTANAAMLADGVVELGIEASRDQVEGELAWLRDLGLATLAVLGPVTRATATLGGLEVAAGRRRVSGIRVPSPADGG